jgi:hypothetical protein
VHWLGRATALSILTLPSIGRNLVTRKRTRTRRPR